MGKDLKEGNASILLYNYSSLIEHLLDRWHHVLFSRVSSCRFVELHGKFGAASITWRIDLHLRRLHLHRLQKGKKKWKKKRNFGSIEN